jgi:hypothetical protein
MKRISIFLITAALIAGMVGCGGESYALAITSTEGGLVISPGEGMFTYDEETAVDLVAEAEAGYRFVNWTGDVVTVADVNAASTNITVSGSYFVTANFAAVYDLTVYGAAGGNIAVPGEATFTYDAGTVVDLVANPDTNYEFARWIGDLGTIANIEAAMTTITMNGDKIITARFEPLFMVSASHGSYGHTVGLKSDGTVVAAGNNGRGQCDVGNWTDIIQVAAGDRNTVGLKSDGTAVALGYDYLGQCDVGNWTDIVQVATGGDHTVGLKSDGTVVAVGNNGNGQCDVDAWADIIQVSVGTYLTVGLKSDGTVVAVGACYEGECDVRFWTDIVQVSAGNSYTVGLKSDGTVVATGGNWTGQCNVGGWTGIVQVSAGGGYTVGLESDGTVVAVGNNGAGQCDVDGWTLN